jgi:hypothetical protein
LNTRKVRAHHHTGGAQHRLPAVPAGEPAHLNVSPGRRRARRGGVFQRRLRVEQVGAVELEPARELDAEVDDERAVAGDDVDAVGAVEGAWATAGNALTSLSEQQIVSCDKKGGNAGCNGGEQITAMDWIAKQAAPLGEPERAEEDLSDLPF